MELGAVSASFHHGGFASSLTFISSPDQPSKAAVNHLTSSLAIKLLPRNVTYASF